VFPDIARTITAGLADFPTDDDPARLAERLTERLQSVNSDGHLRVRHRPGGASVDAAALDRRWAVEARDNAGGLHTVQRIDERTGLIRIAPYLSAVHLAEPYVAAAFTLLGGVSRLIIDLRDGHGGTPETVALICGYLLSDEPVHLQDILDRDGAARQFWTQPAAARLDPQVQIAVLTSAGTFSGCEELAYNLQSLGRATVIGETTGGGAHPVEIFPLTDVLEVTVPVARSVNAVTHTNWEQVGVVPDIRCLADEALTRAMAVLK
jgi:C-terminal processing protease CtpA/Prc